MTSADLRILQAAMRTIAPRFGYDPGARLDGTSLWERVALEAMSAYYFYYNKPEALDRYEAMSFDILEEYNRELRTWAQTHIASVAADSSPKTRGGLSASERAANTQKLMALLAASIAAEDDEEKSSPDTEGT